MIDRFVLVKSRRPSRSHFDPVWLGFGLAVILALAVAWSSFCAPLPARMTLAAVILLVVLGFTLALLLSFWQRRLMSPRGVDLYRRVRGHGLRYWLWFVAHSLLWVLLGMSGFVWLHLVHGPQPWVLTIGTGLLAVAWLGGFAVVAGSTWSLKHGVKVLGVCWRPLSFPTFFDSLRSAGAVVFLGRRVEAARRRYRLTTYQEVVNVVVDKASTRMPPGIETNLGRDLWNELVLRVPVMAGVGAAALLIGLVAAQIGLFGPVVQPPPVCAIAQARGLALLELLAGIGPDQEPPVQATAPQSIPLDDTDSVAQGGADANDESTDSGGDSGSGAGGLSSEASSESNGGTGAEADTGSTDSGGESGSGADGDAESAEGGESGAESGESSSESASESTSEEGDASADAESAEGGKGSESGESSSEGTSESSEEGGEPSAQNNGDPQAGDSEQEGDPGEGSEPGETSSEGASESSGESGDSSPENSADPQLGDSDQKGESGEGAGQSGGNEAGGGGDGASTQENSTPGDDAAGEPTGDELSVDPGDPADESGGSGAAGSGAASSGGEEEGAGPGLREDDVTGSGEPGAGEGAAEGIDTSEPGAESDEISMAPVSADAPPVDPGPTVMISLPESTPLFGEESEAAEGTVPDSSESDEEHGAEQQHGETAVEPLQFLPNWIVEAFVR